MTRSRIYLSPPDVGPEEEVAVVGALRSGWVAPLGPDVDGFEQDIAARTSRRHAVALSSGTAALHLALLDLGIGPGDVVLTATMTFAATANAVRYTGAQPVFVDCDPTGCMSSELLDIAITDQRRQKASLKAVLVVDLLGRIANYEQIDKVAADHGVPVVSDAAESFGAVTRGHPAGSFGVSAAVSFNGNKVMTTSGGGALLTDSFETAQRARYLATQARQPVLHYEHTEVGYNYRLSNLLAAMGRAQLRRLDKMIERRQLLRDRYRKIFKGVPGVELLGDTGKSEEEIADGDNFWLTSILVDDSAAGWNHTELIAALAAADIESRPLWKPMHRQPVYSGTAAYLDGTSEQLFARGVSLPSGSAMTEDDQRRVFDVLDEFLAEKTGPG